MGASEALQLALMLSRLARDILRGVDAGQLNAADLAEARAEMAALDARWKALAPAAGADDSI